MAESDRGRLRIVANRAGIIDEVRSYLNDIEAAYLGLYWLGAVTVERLRSPRERLLVHYMFETGLLGLLPWNVLVTSDLLEPGRRLVLSRVHIESPGFWEFEGIGSILREIREYINDRDRRRQDHEFRAAAERERLQLENEVIRNKVVKDRIDILRELGLSESEINQIVWARIGAPLTRLGNHQDSGMIGSAEDEKADEDP